MQRLQLEHVQSFSQIVTTNKPTPSFLQAGCPSCRPTNSVKALTGKDGRCNYWKVWAVWLTTSRPCPHQWGILAPKSPIHVVGFSPQIWWFYIRWSMHSKHRTYIPPTLRLGNDGAPVPKYIPFHILGHYAKFGSCMPNGLNNVCEHRTFVIFVLHLPDRKDW